MVGTYGTVPYLAVYRYRSLPEQYIYLNEKIICKIRITKIHRYHPPTYGRYHTTVLPTYGTVLLYYLPTYCTYVLIPSKWVISAGICIIILKKSLTIFQGHFFLEIFDKY